MGEEGGHLVYPLKRLQKLDHKNAIEHKKKLSQPQVPPSKEFENNYVSLHSVEPITFTLQE